MAGHSKWANIQHRKRAQDAKRGKLFTKLIREITVAARMGGEDANANPRLRAAIDTALSGNMKRDVIDRAIKRGAGGLDGQNVVEVNYEGYGPGGVAVLVECMTDNKNRTVAEVRFAFNKAGGNLGTEGSVAYLFEKVGLITFTDVKDVDALLECALEFDCKDVETHGDTVCVMTEANDFSQVKQDLQSKGFVCERAQLSMEASTQAPVNDLKQAEQIMALVDRLEDLDDVQAVHTNADFDDNIISQME